MFEKRDLKATALCNTAMTFPMKNSGCFLTLYFNGVFFITEKTFLIVSLSAT